MRRVAVLALLLLMSPLSARADDDLTVANLNVLHGLGCNPDQCRLADRIDLMFLWLADAGCPDVATFQEVNDANNTIKARNLIEAGLPTVCGGIYAGNSFFSDVLGVDEEMVISRYPLHETEVLELHSALAPGFTRHVTRVRIGHPQGDIDVFTTHLSSSADNATDACDADLANPCPIACTQAGASTYRECQAVQLVDFVESTRGVSTPSVITGDMNAVPSSFEVLQLTNAGYTDTFLAAGNSECLAATGAGCTSGRASSISQIEASASNMDRRIDYIFLVPPSGGGQACSLTLDPATDDDADGTATRIFGDDPNPFAVCGPGNAVCWASDHEGNELDLNFASCTFASVPALSDGSRLLLVGLLAAVGLWARCKVFPVACTRV